MTKSAHTPGCWQIGGQFNNITFVNAGSDCVARCDGKNHKANARLIAAAPDLLAALKAQNDPYLEPHERAEMKRAALAKVRGE